MKHTPAPWFLHREGKYEYIASGDGLVAQIVCDDGTNEDQDANAALIAAAPELLEVAHYLARLDDTNMSMPSRMAAEVRKARAAIAKAGGAA